MPATVRPEQQPLDGLRVVSLAVNLPGPLAAARLRELGAEVTKVEPPSGDPLERYAAGWYAELAEGQRVLRLDLRDGAGRAELDALLQRSDLLLTSMRPSAAARLGLPGSVRSTGSPTSRSSAATVSRRRLPGTT